MIESKTIEIGNIIGKVAKYIKNRHFVNPVSAFLCSLAELLRLLVEIVPSFTLFLLVKICWVALIHPVNPKIRLLRKQISKT